mgnify:CR=1 FL=1
MKLFPEWTELPTEPVRRMHAPSVQPKYRSYVDCLRWDFGFTCPFCLMHEPDLTSTFCVEHFEMQSTHPELSNAWLVGGGSGHGYKHGIMLGDYVARGVTGQDNNPELAATFALKAGTF